jgi:hypothetical protein
MVQQRCRRYTYMHAAHTSPSQRDGLTDPTSSASLPPFLSSPKAPTQRITTSPSLVRSKPNTNIDDQGAKKSGARHLPPLGARSCGGRGIRSGAHGAVLLAGRARAHCRVRRGARVVGVRVRAGHLRALRPSRRPPSRLRAARYRSISRIPSIISFFASERHQRRGIR